MQQDRRLWHDECLFPSYLNCVYTLVDFTHLWDRFALHSPSYYVCVDARLSAAVRKILLPI